ncbi:MAG: MBL fold metallo-hydrolase [Planctomycetota bacterium]|nr:MAG: MBL fold metallo-hydrolase [Planctomycetota bacterium]
MPLTRREFTAAMLGAAGASALAPAALARLFDDDVFFEWRPVADGAWAILGAGGNALLIKSRDETLLIDCKNFGLGPTLLEECLRRTDAITLALNTHHHGDHVGGNPTLNATGVPIVAHANAEPRLAQTGAQMSALFTAGQEREAQWADQVRGQGHTDAGGERAAALVPEAFAQGRGLGERAFVPSRTVGDADELRVGDLTVQLRHIGPGHTDNDVYAVIPQLNLLHTGDLCFHRLHPFIDMGAGASSAGWIESCDAMLAECDADTTVIPGHGEIGDRSAIRGQREYFSILRDRMAEARAEGLSRDEAVALTIDEFEGYGFERIKERTFGDVYDEMGAG